MSWANRRHTGVDPGKGTAEVFLHGGERVGGRHVSTTHKNIVPTILAGVGQDQTGNFTQATLCAVPRDGISDFPGTGKSHARAGVFFGSAIPRLQQK